MYVKFRFCSDCVIGILNNKVLGSNTKVLQIKPKMCTIWPKDTASLVSINTYIKKKIILRQQTTQFLFNFTLSVDIKIVLKYPTRQIFAPQANILIIVNKMKSVTESKIQELNFFGSDPGAVKYGNFINYYSFHDVKQRINNLQPEMFPKPVPTDIFCLDIGCNTGDLTRELNSYLKTVYTNCKIYMLAVDIDPTLIQRAEESNNNPNISFIALNIMTESDHDFIQSYLDLNRRKTFDITFCFSVTMWIHLNNGDTGLIEFLKFIKTISRSIIIEPQPWNCYRNAQKRVKRCGKTFELYESLKIRNDVANIIEEILTDNTHKKIYESPNSSWNRKIQSYCV